MKQSKFNTDVTMTNINKPDHQWEDFYIVLSFKAAWIPLEINETSWEHYRFCPHGPPESTQNER